MAAGDPIFINLAAGTLVPQEGSGFEDGEPGAFDTGTRIWLTRADTDRSAYPQKGDPDSEFADMYVSKVSDRLLDSRLVEITATYKGSVTGDAKPAKLTPGADVQMFTLPARQGSTSGAPATVVAPVPMPTLQREYVAFTEPTLDGVGSGSSESFLPTPPSFTISYYPNLDQPLTLNYLTGWVLQSRTWDDATPNTWLVRENYVYYYNIAV